MTALQHCMSLSELYCSKPAAAHQMDCVQELVLPCPGTRTHCNECFLNFEASVKSSQMHRTHTTFSAVLEGLFFTTRISIDMKNSPCSHIPSNIPYCSTVCPIGNIYIGFTLFTELMPEFEYVITKQFFLKKLSSRLT